MQLTKFNVNNNVRVKLTDAGRQELKRQSDEFNKAWPGVNIDFSRQEDENGFTRWQMHELMNVFGHMMTMTQKIPFDTEILIEQSS